MAKPMTLGQITTAYTKWHVPYKIYPGAATRGRPGGITDAGGITKHHTGGGSASASYLKFLFETGRPAEGIPGPLCSEATAPEGVVWIGAVGRANHAGSGSKATHDHVVAENYPGYTAEMHPGPDGFNGNAVYYGDEMIYSGTVPPTARQYRCSVLSAAARCDFHGWSALSVLAHREHSRRKSDPYGINMATMRKDIAACLKAGPAACVNYVATGKLQTSTPPSGGKPTPPTGGNMTLTNADLAAIEARSYDGAMRANRDYGRLLWGEGGTAGEFMQRTDARLVDQTNRLIRIEADTDALQAQMSPLHVSSERVDVAPMRTELLAQAAPLLAIDGGTGTLPQVAAELDEPHPQEETP